MFVHTSAPLTLDFGCSYDGASTLYLGDDTRFIHFLGEPKEILSEYTASNWSQSHAAAVVLWFVDGPD